MSELWANTGIFIHTILKVSDSDIGEEMIENARHIRDAKKQIPNEVLVASIDPHTRDLVARHAINPLLRQREGTACPMLVCK